MHGDAYTLDVSTSMCSYPTFYVWRFKAYLPEIPPLNLPISSVPLYRPTF